MWLWIKCVDGCGVSVALFFTGHTAYDGATQRDRVFVHRNADTGERDRRVPLKFSFHRRQERAVRHMHSCCAHGAPFWGFLCDVALLYPSHLTANTIGKEVSIFFQTVSTG